jgi:hypothetical protein
LDATQVRSSNELRNFSAIRNTLSSTAVEVFETLRTTVEMSKGRILRLGSLQDVAQFQERVRSLQIIQLALLFPETL